MQHSDNRFIEIARIGKSHGLDGTVRVTVSENADDHFTEGDLLYLENGRGDMIPIRILEIRIEEKSHARLFFVKFDRITDRSQAESLRDVPVFTDKKVLPGTDADPDSYEGYEVRDSDELIGHVAGFIENPAQTLITVTPADEDDPETLLIPWVDEYVLSVDEKSKTFVCRNLDQLKNI